MSNSDHKPDHSWVKDIKEGSVKKMTKDEMIEELKRGQAGQRTIAVKLGVYSDTNTHYAGQPRVIIIPIGGAVARSVSRMKAKIKETFNDPEEPDFAFSDFEQIISEELQDFIGSIYLSSYELEEQ